MWSTRALLEGRPRLLTSVQSPQGVYMETQARPSDTGRNTVTWTMISVENSRGRVAGSRCFEDWIL